MKVKVTQSYLTLCNPMDYTVCRILQARILEWAAFPFFRGSSHPQRLNSSLPHCRRILYQMSQKGSPRILEWVAGPFSSESSWPRNWTGVSAALQADCLSTELSGKPYYWSIIYIQLNAHIWSILCSDFEKCIHPVIASPNKIKNISNTQKIPIYSSVINLTIP